MEKKIEMPKTSDELLEQEYSLLKEKEEHYALLKKNDKRRKRERFNTHGIYLFIIVIILLLWKNCANEKDAQNANLTQQIDSLKNANNLLQKEKENLKNRKPVLSMMKYVNGDQLFTAIIGNANDKRPSVMLVKAKHYPVKEFVPYPEFTTYNCPECLELDSCVMDTMKVELIENSPNSSNQLSKEFRVFPVSLYSGSLSKNNAKLLDCNNQLYGKIKPYSYMYSYNRATIDKSLIKSAKIKHWAATGLRVLAMISYNRLYHSNQQYAVTINGVGPYEEGNPYKEQNLKDRKIAKQKSWLEAGIWILYGTSEVVDYSSQCDYSNAYSSEMMNVTVNINF